MGSQAGKPAQAIGDFPITLIDYSDAEIIGTQIDNVFICRGSFNREQLLKDAKLRQRPRNNLILAGIGFEIFFLSLILFTPLGQRIFGTVPPPMLLWPALAAMALVMIGIEKLRILITEK